MREFRHRKAETVVTSAGATILRLVRGDGDHPTLQIHACFNLTGMVASLPAGWTKGKSVLFTSAAPRYGGSAANPAASDALAPFECRVLRLTEETR